MSITAVSSLLRLGNQSTATPVADEGSEINEEAADFANRSASAPEQLFSTQCPVSTVSALARLQRGMCFMIINLGALLAFTSPGLGLMNLSPGG